MSTITEATTTSSGTTMSPGTTTTTPGTTIPEISTTTPGTTTPMPEATTPPATTSVIPEFTTPSGTTGTFPGTTSAPGTNATFETTTFPGTTTTVHMTTDTTLGATSSPGTTTVPGTITGPGTTTSPGTTTIPKTTDTTLGATSSPGTTTIPGTITGPGTTTGPGIPTGPGTTTTTPVTTTSTPVTTTSTPVTNTTTPVTNSTTPRATTSTPVTTTSTPVTNTSTPVTTTSTPVTNTTTPTPTTSTPRPTTTTTTTRTTTTTTTPGTCDNGGTWANGQCQCLPGFTGATCSDISNTIETNAETNGTVQVVLRVSNREFTQDLENASSPTYKEFVQNFIKQMDVVYAGIEGYKGIEVQRLRPGSVVVDHTVIVSLMVTSQSQEKLQNITNNVQEKITAAATQLNCTNGQLCFNSSEVVVNSPVLEFDEDAYCRSQVPNGYQEFFFPNLTSSGLSCMSNCTPGTASTIDCNRGTCHITRRGPQCFCDETHLYWYQDERCTSRVSKVAVGLGLAVAVLVTVVAVLSIFLFRARRSGSHNMAEQKMVENWYQDTSEEWSPQGIFTFRNQGAQLEDDHAVGLEAVETSVPIRIPRPQF
ncbi:PREDICTED: mucin-17-like [Sturnus vulgaris]|uniref:mucin-17-like n=1 Tax=Sturnus vulgaris TaxID=9172 RepID=UPI00071A6B6D|nr:PREDICTED: mucin-17-like [Sturnus vulgaris]